MVHKITFVIIVCAVALIYGQTVQTVREPPQPPPTTSSPNSTTTEPATTKPTTPTTAPTTPTTAPTTPTTAPTTPTTAPTTPTTAPTTPTTAPTTPTTSTTPPYPQPTTSTSEPPTTPTPKPSPKPPQKPDVGKWNVTDHTTNKTCILVDMAIQLNISYIGNDNKTKNNNVNVPKDADASGSCGKTIQVLVLEWNENNISFGHLNLTFLKNDTTNHFWISMVNLTVKPDDKIFPDIQDKNDSIVLLTEKAEFSTSVNKSYRCGKEQSFVLKRDNGINETNSEMLVSHVQMEAFITGKDAKFGAAEDCEPSSSPDIVPIAVGCALVGLVAIVLIAYLVGRRRSQARGYLSMPAEDPDS